MLVFRKPIPGVEHPEMPADVVIVGGGPAGMACALRLSQLIDAHNARYPRTQISKETIYVLEKSREAGQHCLSGALLDPRSMKELLPGCESEGGHPRGRYARVAQQATRREIRSHEGPQPADLWNWSQRIVGSSIGADQSGGSDLHPGIPADHERVWRRMDLWL